MPGWADTVACVTAAGDVFAEFWAAKGYVVADGAMGTQLFALGLTAGNAPERWNVDAPEKIRYVHRGNLRAGADLLLTNSFGGNSFRLRLHDLDGRVAELNEAAAGHARRAASLETAHTGRTVLVAGSMGPTGELLAPLGSMTVAACEAAFAEQAEGLATGGVDLLWIETMSDLAEAEAAVRGARRACDLPVAVTMSFDTAGRTMMGVTGTEAAERLGAMGLAALGANCGNKVADTEAAALEIHAAAPDVPVIFNPNAGIPQWAGHTLVYNAGPDVLAAHAHRAVQAGVRIVGACCGSTPAHVARMAAVLAGRRPVPELDEEVTTGEATSTTGTPARDRSRSHRRRRR